MRDARGGVAIPRGATTELVVRRGANNELYLDLDSVTVSGQRIIAKTVLWAAGVAASPAARWLGAAAEDQVP